MDRKYIIRGGKPLTGDVQISGAKNSAVAILPATIFVRGVVTLDNVPDISDVHAMLDILKFLGARVVEYNGPEHKLVIDTSGVRPHPIGHALTGTCRASYYLLGALLGCFGTADVAMPGGCAFGSRPINLHIMGFRRLGAEVEELEHFAGGGGGVTIRSNGLRGARISFDKESVGATINVMMAAAFATGRTTIQNAAREPHIVDLASFLNQLGARIMGAGTENITIDGVPADSLKRNDISHSIIADQIEAGTFMTAAAATRGNVTLYNVIPTHLRPITDALTATGVCVEEDEIEETVRVWVPGNTKLSGTNITARPYPSFPTDMQPQMTAFLSTCGGDSKVSEEVWDTRFGYVRELRKFGARIIQYDNKNIKVEACLSGLHGASVEALDLRAGAAMLVAGLAAEGVTEVTHIEYIERGYENVVSKLEGLGADITVI